MAKPEGRADPPLVTCSPFPRGHDNKRRSRGTEEPWAAEQGSRCQRRGCLTCGGSWIEGRRCRAPGTGSDLLAPCPGLQELGQALPAPLRAAPERGRGARTAQRTRPRTDPTSPPGPAPGRAIPGHPRGAPGTSGGRDGKGKEGKGGVGGGDRRPLTVVPVKFSSIDPVAPGLPQHRLGAGQGPALPDGRHCRCGGGGAGAAPASSASSLAVAGPPLPLPGGRAALLPPDVTRGPRRHSFRCYNVTRKVSGRLRWRPALKAAPRRCQPARSLALGFLPAGNLRPCGGADSPLRRPGGQRPGAHYCAGSAAFLFTV